MLELDSTMKKIMRTWDLVLMNVTAIIGLRWLPLAAGYGASSISLWVMAALLFLLPLGMVSSELATAWPDEGGVYVWVKEAYGEKAGFIVSWFYWTNSFFFFPSLLIFVAVTLAFVIDPALATNKVFVCTVVLVSLWLVTFLNFRSMRIVKGLSNLSGTLGIILPGIIIVVLGFAAVLIWHKPIPTDYSFAKLIPDFGTTSNIAFLSTLMFSMAGLELTPTLAGETHDPKRTFPRALFISSALIVGMYIIGTVAITMMIAPEKIGAASGIMDGLKIISADLHLPYVLTIVALMIVLSGLGGASVWSVVPIKMLHESCKNGILPKFFMRLNKNDMPRNAMIVQSLVVTVIILGTSVLPSVNAFYEILILMATITYFIPYLFMFATFIKLRKIRPDQPRPYRVPGGNVFPWILAVVGFISVAVAIILPFVIPPKDVQTAHDILVYRLEILSGPVIFLVLGLLLHSRYQRKIKRNSR